MDLPEARKLFLDYCQVEKKLSSHTINAYRGDLQQFEKRRVGLSASLDEFTEQWVSSAIYAWRLDPDLKASTVKRRLASLKVFTRWLFQEGLTVSNVTERLRIKIKLPKRLPRNVQTIEMRKLVAVDPEVLAEQVITNGQTLWDRRQWDRLTARLAIEILTLTGVRVGELASIQIQDIDYTARQIYIVGKGNRERRVVFPDRVTSTRIRSYRLSARQRFGVHVSDALLLNGLGRPATDQYLRRIIRVFAENAALAKRVTPHMLRHTAATQLLEAGVDIRFVQKLLGHASITTTEIYTHVADHALRERISRVNIRKRLEIDR
jgi:site-specific recombinase XerD